MSCMDTAWQVRGRVAGMAVPSCLAHAHDRGHARTRPHGKDKRRFPAWSTRLVKRHARPRDDCHHVGLQQDPATHAAFWPGCVIDYRRSQQSKILAFIYGPHSAAFTKALTFRFLAFLHRTGTGERGGAVRLFLNRACRRPPNLGLLYDARTAREATHGTRERAGGDYRKDFS